MKKSILIVLLVSLILLSSCVSDPEDEVITIPTCDQIFTMTYQEDIPILSMEIPYSTYRGNVEVFIHPCKPTDQGGLTFTDSALKTHQVIIHLDAIYPLESMELITNIPRMSIETSYDSKNYSRIINDQEINSGTLDLGGNMAKSVKLIFAQSDQELSIGDLRLSLDEGYIIQDADDYSNIFLRYQGWTGADGIFSFNLTNGNEAIGAEKNTVGFIFSDTFVGEVYPNNFLRKTSVMINNSLGYMNTALPLHDAFTFDYHMTQAGTPKSPFLPDHYIGKKLRNLLDGDGLSITQNPNATLTNSSEGISYRTDVMPAEIIIDLHEVHDLGNLYLWNDNSDPSKGTKTFDLSTSIDGILYNNLSTHELAQASGNPFEPHTISIDLSTIEARYVKLILTESYDETSIGLGKLMIFDDQEQFLFGSVSGTPAIDVLEANENSARVWLQDGVVLGDQIYIFPILVKDYSNYFMVHNVGLIRADIVNERINYENATYFDTPLQVRTEDGGIIYFGAGLLNNVERDGYIYIYGYKDLNGRHLVVGRFLPEDILHFNRWTYFNGSTFTHNINEVSSLIEGVSAELSVTYLPSGEHAGKYMLVVMENTTSGTISYALSDTPYGTFGGYQKIYQTNVSDLRGAFTYNAKMHPALSKEGEYFISYNVNTTQLGALSDARIYYPRFIRMIEVKR